MNREEGLKSSALILDQSDLQTGAHHIGARAGCGRPGLQADCLDARERAPAWRSITNANNRAAELNSSPIIEQSDLELGVRHKDASADVDDLGFKRTDLRRENVHLHDAPLRTLEDADAVSYEQRQRTKWRSSIPPHCSMPSSPTLEPGWPQLSPSLPVDTAEFRMISQRWMKNSIQSSFIFYVAATGNANFIRDFAGAEVLCPPPRGPTRRQSRNTLSLVRQRLWSPPTSRKESVVDDFDSLIEYPFVEAAIGISDSNFYLNLAGAPRPSSQDAVLAIPTFSQGTGNRFCESSGGAK